MAKSMKKMSYKKESLERELEGYQDELKKLEDNL